MIVWHDSWFDRINQLSSKPTPSCSGPGTVFYIKGAGAYQSVALTTRRLAACRLPMLVHGEEIPMELWCYIGQASTGTVCLALTDTKQWVLFLLPRSRSGMVLLGHLGCGRVYVESQHGFHPSSISVNSKVH